MLVKINKIYIYQIDMKNHRLPAVVFSFETGTNDENNYSI
jgi:hypothetical protein